MSLSRTRRVAMAAAAVAATAALPSAASAAYGPFQQSFPGAATYGVANSNADPQGSNDWTCQPSAAHPRPVVLVHGTTETKYMNWAFMSPKLKQRGLCIYAIQYGDRTGYGPAGGAIKDSAKELGVFVDKVLAATGADKVDIVGHSQGGMMPRQYIKFEGGASKVANLVAISPSTKGTTLSGIATLGKELNVLTALRPVIGPGAIDQTVGSPFMTTLNAGGMTFPGINYTVIQTKFDEVVTPYQNAYITDNRVGALVKNIGLQNGCGTNFADHLNISYSVRTLWFVENALGVAPGTKAPCDIQLPLF